jgi:hypothetical protein
MNTMSFACTRPLVSAQIISLQSAESRENRTARNWLIVILNTLVLTLTFSGLALAQTDPFVGTWKLNVAKSTPARKSETRIVESSPTGMKVSVDRTNADGSNQQYNYTTDFSGKPHPITGMAPYGADSIAVTLGTSNSLSFKLMKGGKVVGSGTTVVSPNGKTLTLKSNGTDDKGMAVNTVSIYEKQ